MQEPCVFEFADSFNQNFLNDRVQLTPGANEPFYQAPKPESLAIIFSNQDFFSSALHELAHWSIAGHARRQQDDYGYWYSPDGRSEAEQLHFFKVEVKPQALEWAFHLAANQPFKFSLDNLINAVPLDAEQQFRNKVFKQLKNYFKNGFPASALKIIQLLCLQYGNLQPIQVPQGLPDEF